MNDDNAAGPVERLYPFVLRARILMVGRELLRRSKGRLHFVLITQDVSETSRKEVLADFAHYPVVQHYSMADLEQWFGIQGAKVIGFAKSGLAQSVYAGLKPYRINRPPAPPQRPESPPTPPSVRKARPRSASRRRDRR